ncbi:MAG TPA: DUF2334 domain-containing protein [Clostridiales bacterium]|nr:DUF2334 domain-containing protein [Clostridiales bacterium]
MYLIRLDDACPYYDVEKWQHVEGILDMYKIKPIVAVIPKCQDKMFVNQYQYNDLFWDKARHWQDKGWTIALHGYNHVYTNMNAKGLNPINNFSEFVGLSYEEQCEKIYNGVKIMNDHGLHPKCFVAPAHSFDTNTLIALKNVSCIRVISDTVANDIYYKHEMLFIPQQCGSFIRMPLKIITCCYHPNAMQAKDIHALENVLAKYKDKFTNFDSLKFKKRNFGFFDYMLKNIYFARRKMKRINIHY